MVATLADMLRREFGVDTRPVFNPETVTVGVTPIRVFSNNPNRLAWVFVNLGGNDLYLAHLRSVSATNGILLANSGGGMNYKWDEEFDLVGYEVFAVAPGGPTAIYSFEIMTASDVEQVPRVPFVP